MIRQDDAYWQRLRKDKATAFALGAAIIAGLAATVSVVSLLVPDAQFEARGNPLYWGLMLPLAWWGARLTTLEPGPVRMLKPVLILAPVIATGSLVAARLNGAESTPWMIGLVVTFAAALASFTIYQRSLLKREGPAR